MSDSKQWLYTSIGIHHVSLDNCLLNGNLYLNRFLFSLDYINEFPYENILISDSFISLINSTRLHYKPNQPAQISIKAENVDRPELTRTFLSVGEASIELKWDRGTIRKYIQSKSKGLYRNQWKFTIISDNSK